jgi:hypothetical protein
MGHAIFGPKYKEQSEMWEESTQTPAVLIWTAYANQDCLWSQSISLFLPVICLLGRL